MKKVLVFMGSIVVLAGCGDAMDGDAATDTTSIVDPGVPPGIDTANHYNTSTGIYPNDTMISTAPGQGSSPTTPRSRSTTPGVPDNKN